MDHSSTASPRNHIMSPISLLQAAVTEMLPSTTRASKFLSCRGEHRCTNVVNNKQHVKTHTSLWSLIQYSFFLCCLANLDDIMSYLICFILEHCLHLSDVFPSFKSFLVDFPNMTGNLVLHHEPLTSPTTRCQETWSPWHLWRLRF